MHIIRVAAFLALANGRLLAQHHHGDERATYGSGTSLLPDSSTHPPALAWSRGPWMLSAHGSINAFYNEQRTQRGDREVGVIDWEMLMAMRPLGMGQLTLRAMTSMEPFVLGGDGYAELLQTGGSYRHAFLHDRQHPHAAVVELASLYDMGQFFLYVGAVGEPASGPVAFGHRPSAEADPFAPLGHHWQDASHQSFGVVTTGVRARGVQLEGSVFNAREADEGHLIADFRGARLDSYSGRVSWSATSQVVASAWWSYLGVHDRLDPDTKMHRYGASVMHVSTLGESRQWATTAVWGMNLHHHTGASHLVLHGGPNASPHHHASSALLESRLDVTRSTTLFARLERVMKNGEELGFLGGDLTDLYEIRSVSVGGTRTIAGPLAIGARGAVNLVPESLRATYGTTKPTGFAIFLQLRPGP